MSRGDAFREFAALVRVVAGNTPNKDLVPLDFTEDGVTHKGAITVEMQIDARRVIDKHIAALARGEEAEPFDLCEAMGWSNEQLPLRNKLREDMVPE